eukprot:6238990-Prymnesium_polylepis.1
MPGWGRSMWCGWSTPGGGIPSRFHEIRVQGTEISIADFSTRIGGGECRYRGFVVFALGVRGCRG